MTMAVDDDDDEGDDYDYGDNYEDDTDSHGWHGLNFNI